MKKYTLLIIYTCVAMLLCITSCKQEDDIDKIFINKTLYMVNGVIQNLNISGDELKTLYKSPSAYYIVFSTNTFSGMLSSGASFSGTWQADGSNRSLRLNITQSAGITTPFDQLLFNILKNAAEYDGDENQVKIIRDGANYIGTSVSRSSESKY